jgi:hypothetical protein
MDIFKRAEELLFAKEIELVGELNAAARKRRHRAPFLFTLEDLISFFDTCEVGPQTIQAVTNPFERQQQQRRWRLATETAYDLREVVVFALQNPKTPAEASIYSLSVGYNLSPAREMLVELLISLGHIHKISQRHSRTFVVVSKLLYLVLLLRHNRATGFRRAGLDKLIDEAFTGTSTITQR